MKLLLCSLATLVILAPSRPSEVRPEQNAPSGKEVAVTVDDLPLNGRGYGLQHVQDMTATLVGRIAALKMPAVGFVNEAQLYVPGEVDERIALLDAWLAAGIELGNHTFSHPSFTATPLAKFQDEVVRGETVTRMLSARRKLPFRYFRHPFLHTGPTLETRGAFERFLAERGYTIAPVTMDGSDWMFGLVYGDAKARGDQEAMRRVADAYLAHTDAVVGCAEAFAHNLFGRQIRHVLLLHANDLNADNFDALARVFERRGYAFVTLERALQDPAYQEPDTYTGEHGIAWLDRWARTRAAKVDRPSCERPEWIRKEYERLQAQPRP